MEKNEPQTANFASEQDDIMNRVNQTYDKWALDVKNMIQNKSEESDLS